jgi:cytochrome P450
MSVVVDPAVPGDVPFIDIVGPRFSFDGLEVRQAQEAGWYARTALGLLVLRYAEAQELLRDRRLDHNGVGYLAMNGVMDGPLYDWFVPMIVNREGEDHRRLRGLVRNAFTPSTVSTLRPYIRARAEELTGQLAAAGSCEFVSDFGDRLPLAVMCELLGVPPQDYDTFRVWTGDIGLVFSLAHGGDIRTRVEAAVVGLYGYIERLMDAKAADPGPDLISRLVAEQRADGQVSREELVNLIVTLVFAAHDNTSQQFTNAVAAFVEHPDQWALLAARPELAPLAVDEAMRWSPSAASVYRFAAADVDYQGVRIPAGTFVMIGVHAAQRDPRVFDDPYVFDITKPRKAPLQFGAGPHHCLGAALAHTELSEALPVLAARLPPPRLAGPIAWRPPTGIYGPDRLPLNFS